MTGPRVYFIQRSDQAIKIGYAKNIRYRMYGLRHATGASVKLLATIGEGLRAHHVRSLEKWLHAKFATHRLDGEWFKPHQDILRFMQEPSMGAA